VRIIAPTVTAEPRSYRPRGSALSKAQEAAIEAQMARYVRLSCGHLTTREVLVIYACFGKVDTFCEVCGDWKQPADKPKPVPVPAEPMF